MPSSEPIGIGIIGAGGIAPTHVSIYAQFRQLAEVVAVYDVIYERAESLAQSCRNQFGFERTKAYESLDDLLADENVQAVSICTPPFAHSAPMLAAAKAGKHVFCEGPMAGTLSECDEMLKAARECKIIFTVQYGHTRFTSSAWRAKWALDEGLLGKVFLAQANVAWYRTKSYYDSAPWRGTWWGEKGGALFHHGRYAVDLFLWLMGEVEELFAYTETLVHSIEIEDTAVLCLRFRNGALGQILATTAAHPHSRLPENSIVIWGSKATMTVLPKFEIQTAEEGKSEELRAKVEENAPVPPVEGMAGQIRDFLMAIVEGREPFISAESTRLQVEVTRAAYKSAILNQPVRLPLKPNDPFY
ncbi:MAG: Gfo/Idh/MocA family oxidoreductase [Armatimonadota bacterium]|nr:Gfo/Idh/MocA family oxidoreductase [Armatimonadota bacterium]